MYLSRKEVARDPLLPPVASGKPADAGEGGPSQKLQYNKLKYGTVLKACLAALSPIALLLCGATACLPDMLTQGEVDAKLSTGIGSGGVG